MAPPATLALILAPEAIFPMKIAPNARFAVRTAPIATFAVRQSSIGPGTDPLAPLQEHSGELAIKEGVDE